MSCAFRSGASVRTCNFNVRAGTTGRPGRRDRKNIAIERTTAVDLCQEPAKG